MSAFCALFIVQLVQKGVFMRFPTTNSVPSEKEGGEGNHSPLYFGKNRSKTFAYKRLWIATCPPEFSDLPKALTNNSVQATVFFQKEYTHFASKEAIFTSVQPFCINLHSR